MKSWNSKSKQQKAGQGKPKEKPKRNTKLRTNQKPQRTKCEHRGHVDTGEQVQETDYKQID